MSVPPLDRTEVGAELRRLRVAAGRTLVQAAEVAGIAQSTLTRYELGRYQGKRVVHLVYEIDRESHQQGPLA